MSNKNLRTNTYLESLVYPQTGTPSISTLPTPQKLDTPGSTAFKFHFTPVEGTVTTNAAYTRSSEFNKYFLRESALVNFFFTHSVDIPLYLKASKTRLNILTGEDERRLTNLLMMHGKKEQNLKVFTQTFLLTHFLGLPDRHENFTGALWRYTHMGLPTFGAQDLTTKEHYVSQLESLLPGLSEGGAQPALYSEFWKTSLTFNSFNYAFSSFFAKNLPMFSFYVQKTDKNILKYSRGRSSKYSLIWKYVPQYNRKRVVSHWLKKEVKLQKAFKYGRRLEKVLELFLFDPNSTLTAKLRRFVHKFVFYKYKKRLLKPLNAKN